MSVLWYFPVSDTLFGLFVVIAAIFLCEEKVKEGRGISPLSAAARAHHHWSQRRTQRPLFHQQEEEKAKQNVFCNLPYLLLYYLT